MPGTYGFTGQRADTSTGLDYYQARYYDPLAGQFTSADSQAAGLNRYGYVKGNPTTMTDPSGHMACDADFGQCVAPTHYKSHKQEITPGPKPKAKKPSKPCPGSCSPPGSNSTSGTDGGLKLCSQDPECMKRYNKWKNMISLDAGAGWTNLIGDMYTLFTEGVPMITEFAALFGGNVAVLVSLVMHVVDVLFAVTDIVRTVTQLLGAQPDGQLQSTIRGIEAVVGTLKLLADMGGAFFAFFNPLKVVEDWFSKAARPFIMKGALSMIGFLATHIGASWLPQMLSVGAEDFLSLTPDQAMEQYQWMRNIDLPTPFAGA